MLTPDEIKQMLSNPSTADWSKLTPRDIGFSLGKPMTEAEMKAYCGQNGIQPKIIKKPDNDSGKEDSQK
jgi:hypothetical protein